MHIIRVYAKQGGLLATFRGFNAEAQLVDAFGIEPDSHPAVAGILR